MADESFICEPENEANADTSVSASSRSHSRPLSGKLDLQKCEDDINLFKPSYSIDRIVQALLVAHLSVNKTGGLNVKVRDVSDHTIYFRFFDGKGYLQAGEKCEFWSRADKQDFNVTYPIHQSSVLLRMYAHALIQYLNRKEDCHPLLSAYIKNCETPTKITLSGAHRRFILNELAYYLFGEKAGMSSPSAPAPWSSQFLLFSAGHVYETCRAVIPKTDMVIWSNYVHTHVLDICKELSRDFPFSPWGEKLFFYYHLIASEVSADAKKILMAYWNFYAGNQPEISEVLNSAWRTLVEESVTETKRISAAQQLASQLSEAIASPDAKQRWFGDESYRAQGIRDINQFVNDLSKLKIDKKSSPINFGRFFSSDN